MIYVADTYNNRVGSYNLDGTAINAALISGLGFPDGVAVSGSTIYVAAPNNRIGSYNLDGTAINTALISGLDEPHGVAVSAVPEPATTALLLGLGTMLLVGGLRFRRRSQKRQA